MTTTKLVIKKMRDIADAIEENQIHIWDELADEFLQALKLLELTHKVVEVPKQKRDKEDP